MVGTFEDAHRAVQDQLRYVGEGCYRIAFADDANKVVYKLGIENPRADRMDYSDYRDNYSNENEFHNWEHLYTDPTRPECLVIPEMSQYEVMGCLVNAMEYVSGLPAHGVLPDEVYDWFEAVGLTDGGHDNVLVSDGKYFLVDMEANLYVDMD